ncbi:hypothetical protein CLCY_2c02530 [Clostridium cylindrosporum DSM 605]|uniref:Uncharacterized protein n=1 Tax=Clostridium cylindrosporum DSM 605 TaxID=1121307 RepID=A0A0J8DB19_CLOCY|nr:hypothetical protein CLCY_2c02530 [Clostridium cylindrosporum DSM 605]
MKKKKLMWTLLKHFYDFTLKNRTSSNTEYYKGKREGMLEIIEMINNINNK